MGKLALVSCASVKAATPRPARELYQSSLFRLEREWIERERLAWVILSAEHGVVRPDQIVAPYDKTLNTMRKPDRLAWASRVVGALRPMLDDGDEAVFFAGRRYREFVAPALHERGVRVSVPLEGLGIGQQLAWLSRQLRHR